GCAASGESAYSVCPRVSITTVSFSCRLGAAVTTRVPPAAEAIPDDRPAAVVTATSTVTPGRAARRERRAAGNLVKVRIRPPYGSFSIVNFIDAAQAQYFPAGGQLGDRRPKSTRQWVSKRENGN